MKEDQDEERLLREVAVKGAKSIFLARQRAEEELVRTREALWRQSELLRVTLTSIGDAVVTTDVEGRIVTLNAVAESLTGWTQPEAQGRPLSEVFRILNEDTRQTIENPADRALREGKTVGLANHTILIAKDGTEIPIDDSAAPIRDDQGRTHGVVLIFRSIAERKQAEKVLRLREAELTDFFENASVGLHWVGPDGIILKVNRAELNMLGYDRDEYLGHHIAEFHADQEVITQILRRLTAGEILRDYEARMRCKDGSIKHVMIDSSGRFEEGRFLHTRCFTRDITDRKQAEAMRSRMAAIVESSQDAIISKTLDGRIVSWNAAAQQIYGYTAEEAIGQPITMLIPQNRHDEERIILARLKRGEPIDHYETVRLTKDGKRVHVSLTISPVLDSEGHIIGASKIARDITVRKQAEQRLAAQYGITHALATSNHFQEAAPKILRAICEQLDWHIGAFWHIVPEENVIRCMDVYHLPNVEASSFIAECRTGVFQTGIGLPGRIWRSGKATWITDLGKDRNFKRAPSAAREGLQSAFGFPILLNEEVWGMMEFFSKETRPPEPELLDTMMAIGSQIGQFLIRKRVEQSLRESEQQLRLALEAGRMGTWQWDIPQQKVHWSAGLEVIHGLLPGAFGGTFEDFQADMHPDDKTRVLESLEEVLKTGKDLNIEYRIVLPGGRVRWIESRGKLFRDETGKPVRMLGVCGDITIRKQAEQTTRFLADASAALSQLTDYKSTLQKVATLAVPDFADWCTVDIVEKDGVVERVAGTHIDAAKVRFLYDLHSSDRKEHSTINAIMQTLRTGVPEWTAEISEDQLRRSAPNEEPHRILRELGIKSYISIPLKSRAEVLGALTFVVTTQSDRIYRVDDVRAAEDLAHRVVIAIENAKLVEALRESDRRKDEFLAMLAHELRNPLAPIRNAVEILRLKGPDLPELRWARNLIDRQVRQLTRLVDDLLDISRITNGKIELRKEFVDVCAILQEALDVSRPLFQELGHTVSMEISSEPITVKADPTRLTQILLNLLNNAAKYTHEGGHISIETQRDGDQAVVRIQDNGIGIPPEMLPKIFEMFTQADRSIERSQGGLGIGLTLAQQLAAMHGGNIEAHSEGRGKGSEFVLRLPLSRDTRTAEEVSSKNKQILNPQRRRILVVDDNHDSADSLALFLQFLGHEVHTAHDGIAAVEEALQFKPRVVFLDIGLPKINGYEAARQIRQRFHDDVVLVALTGWGQEEDRRRSKEAGFNYHLTKPVDFDDLAKLIND